MLKIYQSQGVSYLRLLVSIKFNQAEKILKTFDPEKDAFRHSLLTACSDILSGQRSRTWIAQLTKLAENQPENFRSDLKKYPFKRSPQELLGDIYLSIGDKSKARSCFTNLLARYPDNIRIKNKILEIK